jgi:hypothetical protein
MHEELQLKVRKLCVADENLKGVTMAIFVTDGFEQVELTQPKKAFQGQTDQERAENRNLFHHLIIVDCEPNCRAQMLQSLTLPPSSARESDPPSRPALQHRPK